MLVDDYTVVILFVNPDTPMSCHSDRNYIDGLK